MVKKFNSYIFTLFTGVRVTSWCSLMREASLIFSCPQNLLTPIYVPTLLMCNTVL